MMDTSLKADSDRLQASIKQLIEEDKKEYSLKEKRIRELNDFLANTEKTDLSENMPYQIAKDERDVTATIASMLLERINSMESELVSYVPTGFITLGSTVELTVKSVNGQVPQFDKKKMIIKLVSHKTSKATSNLVAIDSKVGEAILGRGPHETVEVQAPIGKITYVIERIY